MWSAPALVDWCEPNYVYTPWVAEAWNTASSLVLVVLGLYGMFRVHGLRFRLGMLGLAGVGVGSALFHGVLVRFAQAADELPMVWLGLTCVWTIADREKAAGEGRLLAAGFLLFGVLFTIAYATVPWAFTLFLGVYGLLVAWLAVRTAQLTMGASFPIKRAALATIGAYLGSFFVFWVPEHVVLGCDHPLQAVQLHSWWHVGAGVGTYAWWWWAYLDRERVLGRHPELAPA